MAFNRLQDSIVYIYLHIIYHYSLTIVYTYDIVEVYSTIEYNTIRSENRLVAAPGHLGDGDDNEMKMSPGAYICTMHTFVLGSVGGGVWCMYNVYYNIITVSIIYLLTTEKWHAMIIFVVPYIIRIRCYYYVYGKS